MVPSKKEVADYIKGLGEITIPEFQVKFNLDYKTAFHIINDLVDSNILFLADGLTYKLSKEPNISKENASDSSDSISSARAMLERRKQEILRRMQLEVEDDEEDDDEDEETDNEEDDGPSDVDLDEAFRCLKSSLDKINDDDESKKRSIVEDSLSKGIDVESNWRVDLDICYPNDVKYDIFINFEKDKMYFTDTKLTLNFMNENLDMRQVELIKKVNLIKERYGLVTVEDELRCYISEPENALATLFYFLTAIEQLVYLVREDFIHLLSDKIEKRCESLLCEVLYKAKVKEKDEIIKMVNLGLDNAKANNIYDDIIAYEHILTGLNMISDDYFNKLIEGYLKKQTKE